MLVPEGGIWVIVFARCLQGLAGSALLTGAFAEIADLCHSSTDRRWLIGAASIATFSGGAVGPFYGGVTFDSGGRVLTFLLPVILIGACALLMPFQRKRFDRPKSQESSADVDIDLDQSVRLDERKSTDAGQDVEIHVERRSSRCVRPTPIYRLAIDPYILVTALGLFVANFTHNCWFPTLPSWMAVHLSSLKWEQGIVWTPSLVFYVLGTILSTWLCQRLPRWRFLIAILALLLNAALTLPLSFFRHLVPISVVVGMSFFNTAVIEVILLPLLPIVVDARYSEVYGSVSAFASIAFSLATLVSSLFAGYVTQNLGFLALNVGIALVCVLYAPLMIFLRRYC